MEAIDLAMHLGMDRLLDTQNGVIRRDQALALGVSKATIDGHLRAHRWKALHPGVFATDPARASDGRLRIRAAWLWSGPSSVVGWHAAAWWTGTLNEFSGRIKVMTPPDRRLRSTDGVQIVRAKLEQSDIRWYDGIKVTGLNRTALDVASAGCTDVLDMMIRKQWMDFAKLDGALLRGRHRRMWSAARLAAEESLLLPYSYAERLTHRLFREEGLTDWVANSTLRLSGVRLEPDVLFEDVKLVVEIDGRRWHSEDADFERERRNHNLYALHGYTVLKITYRQLINNPELVIRQIRAMLEQLRAAA